jgi:hypothetical protein
MIQLAIETPDICKPCGGKCCQRFPGSCDPEDFGSPGTKPWESKIREAILSGRFCLDDWVEDEQHPDAYFIRPSIIDSIGITYDPSYGGTCNFWTKESGCEMTFDQRPTGCKALKANPNGKHCTEGYGKLDAVKSWYPYKELLEELVKIPDREVE